MIATVGKYQLVRKLATGGMAEVYLAKAAGPRGFEKTLVLKRILPHLAEEASFVEMFLAEAMIAARLTHPHIVQIFDFGEADGTSFLAMEYIDGPSLRTLIKRAAAQRMTLPATLCARIIAQACEGLAFAHDFTSPETGQPLGLIHRDISPDNILLSRQGTAKVVDFGIAKAADQGGRTASGVIKGKVSYMPPEQLRAREMDRRVDVYALGVVLYELLTARKPFESTSEVGLMQAILFEPLVPAEQYRPDLPGPLRAILARALAKERDQRYPDCHAFQADLEEFILSAGKPVTTQQVAQLIQQVTSSGESSNVYPAASPPSGTRFAGSTPTHTPMPAPLRPDDDPSSVPTMQTPVTDLPASRAPRPETTSSAPALDDQETRIRPRSGRGWTGAAMVGLLFLLGGFALVWKMGTPPAAPVPVPKRAGAQPTVTPPPVSPPPERPETVQTPVPTPTPDPTPPPAVVEAPPTETPAPTTPEPVPEPAPPNKPEVKQKPSPIARPTPSKSTAKGTLDLRVRPFATVYVDGKKLGDTPLAPPELSAGRHAVRLVNEEHGEKKYDIVIEPNKPYILKVNFFE